MNKVPHDHKRLEALKRLMQVGLGWPYKPINELDAFDWEYRGEPYTISRNEVSNILQRFLCGDINAEQLETWADYVELREDLRYEEEAEPWIKDVVFTLSSSLLNGSITQEKVKSLLASLRHDF